MEQILFPSDAAYQHAQLKAVRHRGIGPYYSDEELQLIADWMRTAGMRPRRGLCHGARGGHEVRTFRKLIPGAYVLGTDLFPYSGKTAGTGSAGDVIAWDFSQRRRRWRRRWDWVYSNSLDHARRPEQTLAVWYGQLNREGRLFVQWTYSHRWAAGGDCFGASLDEYAVLMNEAGTLEAILVALGVQSRRSHDAFILVGKRRV